MRIKGSLSGVPTILSAFTGAGGLDLGLELAGFRVLACIERDERARASIRLNRPQLRFLVPYDIIDLAPGLTPEQLGLNPGELGMIAAGPPCQPFSKAAQWSQNGRKGIDDPRSNCLVALLMLVDRFLPRVVLIENVPGFAKGRNSAIPVIERYLDRINSHHGSRYRLSYREVDGADYGVPQRRKRAILIARWDGEPFEWPRPTHAEKPIRAYDALVGLRPQSPPCATGKWASLLTSIPEGQNYLWHTPEGGGKALFGYRTRFWSFLLKLAKDEPAWTVPAYPGPATGPFHWKNRPLAVDELLRLQTFPSSWKVEGDYREQVRQVGNATPPLLAEVIGRAIGEQVFGLRYARPLRLRIQRKKRIPPPERASSVSRKYWKLIGEHAPHPGPGRGPKPRSRP